MLPSAKHWIRQALNTSQQINKQNKQKTQKSKRGENLLKPQWAQKKTTHSPHHSLRSTNAGTCAQRERERERERL